MNKLDIDKIMEEIESIQSREEDSKALKSLLSTDSELVEHAVKAVAFMEKLNEKQLQYFKEIQRKTPSLAKALVCLNNEEKLSEYQMELILSEAQSEKSLLVSTKQFRFNLAQDILLDYMAHLEHKSVATFIRDMLIEKVKTHVEKHYK